MIKWDTSWSKPNHFKGPRSTRATPSTQSATCTQRSWPSPPGTTASRTRQGRFPPPASAAGDQLAVRCLRPRSAGWGQSRPHLRGRSEVGRQNLLNRPQPRRRSGRRVGRATAARSKTGFRLGLKNIIFGPIFFAQLATFITIHFSFKFHCCNSPLSKRQWASYPWHHDCGSCYSQISPNFWLLQFCKVSKFKF